MPTPNLAEKIRDRRTQLGLTQTQLAFLAGVDQTAVSKWELGRSIPSLPCAARVAEALELPLYALVEAAL